MGNGLRREELDQPMKSEHSNMIAMEIGNDWEVLGTCINISQEDIHDIWEVHQTPKDKRFALINLWEEQYGSKATYYNMAYGLMQLKRTKLTEKLLTSLKHDRQQAKFDSRRKHIAFLCLALLVIVMLTYYISSQAGLTVPTFPIMALFKQRPSTTNSHFVLPDHDLPILNCVFVGREHDVNEVVSKVMSTRIVNINGAPGFGKSTLAIHAGHEMVKNGIKVRYVNMEESSLSFVKLKGNDISDTEQFETAVAQFHDSSLLKEQSNDLYKDSRFVRELKEWSMTVKSPTVLIFDNCDKILVSSFRYNFVRVINSLIEKSELLNIIVVSRVKLFLVDNFDHWTVKELNHSSSVSLLNEFAPNIHKYDAMRIAQLLQGCPLALKVIGKLLNLRGNQFVYEVIHELESRPIDILDSVSDQRQQFRAIMDLVFSDVNVLQKCGHMISLFPYSFSRDAGISILASSPEKCLDAYEKQSLLDEFFLGNQHRYTMHRLIREYLKEKVNSTDQVKFKKRFNNYYIEFLFNYANRSKLSVVDKHTLSVERLNIELFVESLASHKPVTDKLLVVLAFLFRKSM